MIIGFHKQFVPLIKSGVKIHTIRRDEKDRWVAGKKMHLATGTRTKDYNCFAQKECVSVQYVSIYTERKEVFIHKKLIMSKFDVGEIAKNDGFYSVEHFWAWFTPEKYGKKFVGKIIHWTNKKY